METCSHCTDGKWWQGMLDFLQTGNVCPQR
jgi:uncharacterized protein (DUF983 family)